MANWIEIAIAIGIEIEIGSGNGDMAFYFDNEFYVKPGGWVTSSALWIG